MPPDDATARTSSVSIITRWVARISSILVVSPFLLQLLMEGLDPADVGPVGEWAMFLCFPVGVCLGMIVAWRREGLGGAITVGSISSFRVVRGRLPPGPFFALAAASGVLFLIPRAAAALRK